MISSPTRTISFYLEAYTSKIYPIIEALAKAGGTAYLVGGCVRDMVLDLPLKDLDIEVHGLSIDQLQGVLKQFGHVEEVGKKFGVLILFGLAVDWSLPRSDSSGRKPTVTLQPNLDLTQALKRRDLTMNAMAINLTKIVLAKQKVLELGEIIDPFNGLSDLAACRLRAVDDDFFIQDPLRMLRVMQFIGRFNMQPTAELDALCSRMNLYDEYDGRPLARERIQNEAIKLLLQAAKPSLGFAWLHKIGRIGELFGMLAEEKHQKIAFSLLDNVAQKTQHLEAEQRLIAMLTALCWPWWSENQASSNVRNYLANITSAQNIIAAVSASLKAIVALAHLNKNYQEDVVACKKIAATLKGNLSLRLILYTAWFIYQPSCTSAEETDHYKLAHAAGVLDQMEKPVVEGRDLIDKIPPGPAIGKLLAQAYTIQIEEGITEKERLLQRIV